MSKSAFTSKHDNFIIRKTMHKGYPYIQCKYIGNFSELGTDYFSYNKELFKILRSVHVGLTSGYTNSPSPARGRFRFYDSSAKKQVTIYASHLAYGCYHGLIKYKSLAADALNFKHYLSENELVVDHLNDNQHINTEHNLSVMAKTDNNRKRDIISKIQYPSACIVAYVQGKYRVRLFLRTNIKYFLQEYDASPERRTAIMSKTVPGGRPNYGQFEEHYTCCNSNELLACLRREALKTRRHTMPLLEKHRGSQLWSKSMLGEYWADDIKLALEEQNELAISEWPYAKPVLALRRADRSPEYFEHLKGRVKGLKLVKLPAGKYSAKAVNRV